MPAKSSTKRRRFRLDSKLSEENRKQLLLWLEGGMDYDTAAMRIDSWGIITTGRTLAKWHAAQAGSEVVLIDESSEILGTVSLITQVFGARGEIRRLGDIKCDRSSALITNLPLPENVGLGDTVLLDVRQLARRPRA